jgi:hypothetical protein
MMSNHKVVAWFLAGILILSVPRPSFAGELDNFNTLIAKLAPRTPVQEIEKLRFLEYRGEFESTVEGRPSPVRGFTGNLRGVRVIVNTSEGTLDFASFVYDGADFDPEVLRALEKKYGKFKRSEEEPDKRAWIEGGYVRDVGSFRILVGGKKSTCVFILGPWFQRTGHLGVR